MEWPGFKESLYLIAHVLTSSLCRRGHKHLQGHPALPLWSNEYFRFGVFFFWLLNQTVTSKSSNHQVMGLFSIPLNNNCPYNTEANQQETQQCQAMLHICLLCQSCVTHWPNTDLYKQALPFQDTYDTIRKKPQPFHPSSRVEEAICTEKHLLLHSCAKPCKFPYKNSKRRGESIYTKQHVRACSSSEGL